MDMMMGKRTVECFSKIFEFSDRREEAAETVVPDTMPDIDRILCARGTLVIRSKEAAAGSVTVTAGVAATVLYVPEDGTRVRCLSAAVPVSVTVDAPSVTADCVPVAELTVLSLEARMLNPRKVAVKVCLAVCVACYLRRDAEYSQSVTGEAGDIRTLTRTATVYPVVCAQEKTFVVSDAYALPPGYPPLGELLHGGAELLCDGVSSVGSKLVVKGRARVSAVYAAEDTGALRCARFETPFSQLIETGRELVRPDCSATLLLTAVYLEPDIVSGGERGIACELHLVAQTVCSDAVELTYLTDCYSNRRALDTVTCSENLCGELRRYVCRGEGHDTPETETSPAQVLLTQCTLSEPVYADGTASCRAGVTVVYEDEAGALRALSRSLPLQCQLPPGEGRKVRVVSVACGELKALPAKNALELRLTVDFTVLEWSEERVTQISGVTAGEELTRELWPSITVIRAAPDACLWQIGKRYHSSGELIARANLLEENEDVRGRVLLIPAEK